MIFELEDVSGAAGARLRRLEPVDVRRDQGVSHEGSDVEQGVSNNQWADAFPAQVDQAEDQRP